VRLSLAGARVICIARRESSAAIAREGLALAWQGETLHARPKAVERLEERVELLLVTVKAPFLEDALDRVDGALVTQALVLPLLNGLEHVERLRERFGPRVVAASIGRLEAYREGATQIVQATALPVISIAAPEDLPPEELAPAFDLLRAAGVDVQPGLSEKAVLWEKAARLAPLAAATALTQRPLGELLADPEWHAIIRGAVAESCAAASADGVPTTPASQWEIIAAMPATMTTSTARDVAAGRPSELDAIVGGVVRAARRLGVATPTLDDLRRRLEAS
jgi:2-dehydropantoate 2-reductase